MTKIVIAGCGALGSQIALHLAHPDRQFLLIDDDTIEETNILTTAYSRHHIGAQKAIVLAELLWRKCRCRAKPWTRTLRTSQKLFHFNPNLIIDTFDNANARSLTVGIPICLHVGVSEDRTGAITWDSRYTCPAGPPRGENPVCTHELGTPILRITAALAANIAEIFLSTGEQIDLVVTENLQVLR